MKRSSFIRNVLVGLGIGIAGALTFNVLSALFSNDLVIRWIIAGAGMVYMVRLIRLSGSRVGGVTTVVLWTVSSALLLWLQPTLALFFAAHAALIWIVRSLYYHRSTLSVLTDLGLSFLSFSAAVWAASHTGSVFLSIWCFFLVQALSSEIPPQLGKCRNSTSTVHDDRFQQAYRMAETALSKLSSIH